METGPPPERWRLPKGIGQAPRWTTVRLADTDFGVLVDDSDGRAPRMWVDATGEGDLSSASPFTGDRTEGGQACCSGLVTFRIPSHGRRVREYHASLSYSGGAKGPGTIAVASETWRGGTVGLGGRDFRVVVRDANSDGSYADIRGLVFAFDRDGDGMVDADTSTGEGYEGRERFNLGTGTFRVKEVSEDGSKISFEPIWPPVQVRPFLGVGDLAPALPSEDTEGHPIAWRDFRGKTVLLVFWASW